MYFIIKLFTAASLFIAASIALVFYFQDVDGVSSSDVATTPASHYSLVTEWSFSQNESTSVLRGRQSDNSLSFLVRCVDEAYVDLQFGDFGWSASDSHISPNIYEVEADNEYIGDVFFARAGEMVYIDEHRERHMEFLSPHELLARMYRGSRVFGFSSESEESITFDLGDDGQTRVSEFIQHCPPVQNFIHLTQTSDSAATRASAVYLQCNAAFQDSINAFQWHSFNDFIRVTGDVVSVLPVNVVQSSSIRDEYCPYIGSRCDMHGLLERSSWPEICDSGSCAVSDTEYRVNITRTFALGTESQTLKVNRLSGVYEISRIGEDANGTCIPVTTSPPL